MDSLLNLFFMVLSLAIRGIQPILVPLCFVCAWAFMGLLGWNLWSAMRDGVSQAQQMHRVPCSECRFFTGDYHLKCTVHPNRALSEEAIDCPDFEAVNLMGLPTLR